MAEYEKGTLVFGDWKIVENPGSGSYGTVFKIEKTEYGITAHAALKVIRIPKTQSEIRDVLSEGMDEKSVTSYFQGMVDSLVREIAVMSMLKSHPNIVSYENHKVIPHAGGDRLGYPDPDGSTDFPAGLSEGASDFGWSDAQCGDSPGP